MSCTYLFLTDERLRYNIYIYVLKVFDDSLFCCRGIRRLLLVLLGWLFSTSHVSIADESFFSIVHSLADALLQIIID